MSDPDILGRLPEPGAAFPVVLAASIGESEARLRLDITSELSWFSGHFPGQPVLPGVIQLHWAVLVSRSLFGLESVPSEVKRLKFKRTIVPPREVDLLLSRRAESEVQFRFESSGEPHSEGRIVFPARP